MKLIPTMLRSEFQSTPGRHSTRCVFPSTLKKNGIIYDFHADAGPDFIAVNHIDAFDERFRSAPAVQLYTSDPSLTFFSMSMRAMLRSEAVTAIQDFTNALGLEGIYIANQINYKAFIDGPAMRTDYSSFFETRITFNAGGTWHRIAPPRTPRDASIRARAPSTIALATVYNSTAPWIGAPPRIGRDDSAVCTREASRPVSSYPPAASAAPCCTTTCPKSTLTFLATAVNRGSRPKRGCTFTSSEATGDSSSSRNSLKRWTRLSIASTRVNRGPRSSFQAAKVFVHNIRVDPTSAGHMFIVHGVSAQSSAADPNRGSYFIVDFDNILSQNKPCQASDYEGVATEAKVTDVSWDKSSRFRGKSPAPNVSTIQPLFVSIKSSERATVLECSTRSAITEVNACTTCERHRVAALQNDVRHQHAVFGAERKTHHGVQPSHRLWEQMFEPGRRPRRRRSQTPPPSSPARFSGRVFRPASSAPSPPPSSARFTSTKTTISALLSTTIPNAARNAVNGAYEKFQEKFGRREHPASGISNRSETSRRRTNSDVASSIIRIHIDVHYFEPPPPPNGVVFSINRIAIRLYTIATSPSGSVAAIGAPPRRSSRESRCRAAPPLKTPPPRASAVARAPPLPNTYDRSPSLST